MTSVNNALGTASDELLRATGAMSRPSGWTARELRREKERRQGQRKQAPEPERRGFGGP